MNFDFIKRIGTQRHKFKVQFFVGELSSNAKLKGDIYITIKRGDHKKSIENTRTFGSNGKCDFKNEIITFQSLTLFYDESEKTYQQKMGEIKVVIKTKKGDKKLLGIINFDVSKYANSKKEETSQVIKLEETPAEIEMHLSFRVYCKFIGEASEASKSENKDKKRESSLWDKLNFFKTSPGKEEKEKTVVVQPKLIPRNRSNERPESVKKVIKNDKRKPKQKNKRSSQDEESSDEPETYRNKKNIAKPKEKMHYTEYQYSENEKRKKNDPYFTDVSGLSSSRRKNAPDNSNQIQQFSLKREKEKQESQIREQLQIKNQKYQEENKVLTEDVQKKSEQIKKLKKKFQEVLNEKKDLKQINQNLNVQNESLKRQIKALQQKNVPPSRLIFQTQRQFHQEDPISSFQLQNMQQKVQKLERQKSEILIRYEQLSVKYQKQHQKYEQLFEQLTDEKNEKNETSRAEAKKLQDENHKMKEKLDKFSIKYDQKSTEVKKLKLQNEQLEQELALMKNSLANLKIRIGMKSNEASLQGNQKLMDVLGELLIFQ